MTIEQTRSAFTGLVLFGLACLSASGLAGAHGALELDDVPEGFVKASITDRPDIQGLSSLILSAPRPGIMLRYTGNESFTVLGTEGEALLQFTRTGVSVNTASPSWEASNDKTPALGSDAATASDTSAAPTWVALSDSGSFSWLDPRLNAMADIHHQADTQQEWAIAVRRANGEVEQIRGTLMFTAYK
ncbi:hypothetical protein [Halopseudomonas sp.]|jgi:hypothetical protein|uniref:hypothetical protein n=1 Tax=Halopseudomonas sp. TaxID=2901191 RepID=UPI0039E31596